MRLMDRILGENGPLIVDVGVADGSVVRFMLPGVDTIGASLRAAPLRYVLDDAIAAFTIETAFRDPDMIAGALDLIRLPAPLFWVEWCDDSRVNALAQFGVNKEDPQVRRGRAGLLVSTDASGRRGVVDIVWANAEPALDLAPLRVRFDLDDPHFASHAAADAYAARVDGDVGALDSLLGHAQFQLRSEWRDYYANAAAAPYQRFQAVRRSIELIFGDFIFLLAFALTLEVKDLTRRAPSDLQRLNKARAKRSARPLLDHIEVTTRLDAFRAPGSDWRGSVRAHARLHFVSGHLVRRGAKIFWRRAHLRGSSERGVIRSRTVRLVAGDGIRNVPA